MPSEDGDNVTHISGIEPTFKKSITLGGTLCKVAVDSVRENYVLRTKRHATETDIDHEINCGVGDGHETANVDVDILIWNTVTLILMTVLLVILLYEDKQLHKQGVSTKM